MPANATIYSFRSEFPSIDAVREAAPGAKVAWSKKEGTPENPCLVVTWPDVGVVIRRMPDEQLQDHLAGFQGYLQARCELRDPGLASRVGKLKQCLGLTFDPGFDDEGRCEALVPALTTHLDGVFFAQDCVYAADGELLAWPRDLAEPEAGGAEGEEEAQVEPPEALRVAQRALILGAVAARAFLEDDPDDDREERRQWLLERVEGLGLGPELEGPERRMLEAPVGGLSQRQVIEGSWRSEGLAVLSWALGVSELPAHDESVNAVELVFQRLRLIGDGKPPVLSSPRLRSLEELKRMERKLFVLHWRLRDFSLQPRALDFAEFARTAWFGPFDLTGIALAKDDLAIEGVPISRADREQVSRSQSIAMERHLAINWLLGRARLYSRVDTST
ncbi:DUF4272 domain-containing protein [Pyxidicoccus sp. 3LG]